MSIVPEPNRSITGTAIDERYRRRLLVAGAIALACLEIVAGGWPKSAPPPPPEDVISQAITIVRKTPPPTPEPTPPPTPVPTPRVTPAPHVTLAPHIVVRDPSKRAAATPHPKLGGAAAQKHIVHVTPPPASPLPAPPVSQVAGTNAGQQNGGTGTGAGPGAGNGGLGGTGAGTGTTGTGSGGESNTAPCGFVTLTPEYADTHGDGSVHVRVDVQITLRDGQTLNSKFPYQFVYKTDALDPFAHDDQLTSDGGVPVQMPPSGTDTSQFPPAVQTVLSHTDAQGRTTFPECPKAAATKK